MIVDAKVHVEIVHYKGRQGSNMRPRESFFAEFAKVFLKGGAKDFAKKIAIDFSVRPLRKINVGVRESMCLFACR